jgi:hypothetical protein
MLHGVVVAALRMPAEIVAQVMNLYPPVGKLCRVGRQVRLQVVPVESEPPFQVSHGGAAQVQIGNLLR